MSSRTCGLRVASVVFGLMCLAQMLRIVTRLGIMIGGYPVSRKFSAVAVVITGGLCLWLWLLSTKAEGPAPGSVGAPPPA